MTSFEAFQAIYKAKRTKSKTWRSRYINKYLKLKSEEQMQIKKRQGNVDKMNKIVIYGGALTGKTTLAGKIGKDKDDILVFSTDGNAARQDFITADLEYKSVIGTNKEIATVLNSVIDRVHHVVFDLIEGIEDDMQRQFRANNLKASKPAKLTYDQWDEISAFYGGLYTVLMQFQDHFTYIFISRERDEYGKNKKGEEIILGKVPALRDNPSKIIIPDVDLKVYASNWGGDVEYEIIGKRNVPEQLIKLIEGE